MATGKQGTGREIVKRTPDGLRTTQFSKGTYSELAPDELNASIDMALSGLTMNGGKPATYPDTADGLNAFIERALEYFTEIRTRNTNAADDTTALKVIPDIEGLCIYLGITRKTLCNYNNTRGEEWTNTIELLKGAIVSTRKQLASSGKIPQVFEIFNLTNNFDYVNASEFKIQATAEQTPKKKGADEILASMGV